MGLPAGMKPPSLPLAFAAGAGVALAFAVILSAFVLLDVSTPADLGTLYFTTLLLGWIAVLAAGGMLLIEGLWRRDATGWWLYRAQVTALTERGRPLVESIEQYESDHGAAPSGFGDLVPKYLPNGVPDTELVGQTRRHSARRALGLPD